MLSPAQTCRYIAQPMPIGFNCCSIEEHVELLWLVKNMMARNNDWLVAKLRQRGENKGLSVHLKRLR